MNAETIVIEVEDLAVELFATTYNLSWSGAVTEAICQFRALERYATDWDAECLARREVRLMKLTSCSAEDAIDAIRVADGKPAWSEVLA